MILFAILTILLTCQKNSREREEEAVFSLAMKKLNLYNEIKGQDQHCKDSEDGKIQISRKRSVNMSNMIHFSPEAFSVLYYQTGSFGELSRENLLGHWSILFFYPADFTVVCPTELGDLADLYEQFRQEECEVYSVSEDTHFVHKAWADASETIRRIPFPMLGDPAGILARQFGVLDETAGQAYRATFVLNPDAKVVLYEIHDMGIGRNAEELLRKLQAARFVYEHGDQVCPAKWRPGAETLTPSLDLVGML